MPLGKDARFEMPVSKRLHRSCIEGFVADRTSDNHLFDAPALYFDAQYIYARTRNMARSRINWIVGFRRLCHELSCYRSGSSNAVICWQQDCCNGQGD